MSNYVKATNFTAKDSLQTGNPAKIIKGAEIDDEYNAIATAIATKPDANSPTFTGIPVAPTASAGTNTTQLATTAFATTAIQALYPVGSIYTSTVATNPNTLFGFGTWVAFGAGRVLIGVSGTAPYTAGNTGGSADAVIVDHSHNYSGTTDANGSHNHETGLSSGGGGSSPYLKANTSSPEQNRLYTSTVGNHQHGFSGTTNGANGGVSGTNANLPPYVVVYMWNRTA